MKFSSGLGLGEQVSQSVSLIVLFFASTLLTEFETKQVLLGIMPKSLLWMESICTLEDTISGILIT